jgi:hypothetical protein
MTTAATNRRYRSTESKYKGGAHEMYVTYDLEQKTAADKAPYTTKSSGYISPAKSGIGERGSFGKRRGVKCTAFGSNMSRPARVIVKGGARPGGARRNILWPQGPSLRLLSELSRWSRFRRAPVMCIFILTMRIAAEIRAGIAGSPIRVGRSLG